MKTSNILVGFLAAALSAASAQAAITAADRDVILVFRQAGQPVLQVNAGTVSNLVNAAPGAVVTLGGFDLGQVNQAWNNGSPNARYWGAFAAGRQGMVNTAFAPEYTIWVTKPRTNALTRMPAPPRKLTTSHISAGTVINNVVGLSSPTIGMVPWSAAVSADAVTNTATAGLIPESDPSSYRTIAGTNGNLNGAYWHGSLDGMAPTDTTARADLFELRPALPAEVDSPGVYLGYLEYEAATGVMKFHRDSAPNVPASQPVRMDASAGNPVQITLGKAGLTYQLVIPPTKGNVTFNNHIATYTPTAGQYGSDSFTYVSADGHSTGGGVTIELLDGSTGILQFDNRTSSAARISEIGGSPFLAGDAYRVDMFYGPIGAAPATFTNLGLAVPFGVSNLAGTFRAGQVYVPGFSPNTTVQVQPRAWRLADGASWQEARAHGGHVSPMDAPIVQVALMNAASEPPPVANPLTGIVGHSLVIAQAPVIVQQPCDVVVQPGALLALQVEAVGQIPLSYQWYKNGQAISGAISESYQKTTAETDAGDYQVVVSNGIGSKTSAVARVTVPDVTGPNSSIPPYYIAAPEALAKGYQVSLRALASVGDPAFPDFGGYTMVGIPDGLGAYDNGNGTFTLLMNHELRGGDLPGGSGTTTNNAAAGIARAYGGKGAFVSEWIISKTNLAVLHAQDFTTNGLYVWDRSGNNFRQFDAVNDYHVSRLCSADLPPVGAFYNPATMLGTTNRIFMNGEEDGGNFRPGQGGRAFAHIATGPAKGSSWELPWLGQFAWENSVASPHAQDKTIIMGLDDSDLTNSQVYVYVGTKTAAGDDLQRAGLTNGLLYGLNVNVGGAFVSQEHSTYVFGTTSRVTSAAFTLHSLGNAASQNALQLEAAGAGTVSIFQRIEDGVWDTANPNAFYFVTTGRASGTNVTNPSRLWKLVFTDITQPELGGAIFMVLDGAAGNGLALSDAQPVMMDNIGITADGKLLIQEDPGNSDRLAKLWLFDPAASNLVAIAGADSRFFSPLGSGFLTRDEEASGIIDASEILGPGWYLLDVQVHKAVGGEVVELGQLVAMKLSSSPVLAGSTGVEPYYKPSPTASTGGYEVTIKSLLTVNDPVVPNIGGYQMVGIPDGLGTFGNPDGTFTLLMNHEIRGGDLPGGNGTTNATAAPGVTRAYGGKGSFVSRWVINPTNLTVQSGADFTSVVYLWNTNTGAYRVFDPVNDYHVSRLCSADLAAPTAYYNPLSGKGATNRIFLSGEEDGAPFRPGQGGRAFAHIATGPQAGTTWELPWFGKFAWENAVASPYPQDKTIVIGLDDSDLTNSQVYVIIGQKQFAGSDLAKAGFTNAVVYGVRVNDGAALVAQETNDKVLGAAARKGSAAFALHSFGNVTSWSDAQLETAGLGNVTSFQRIEDGAFDPRNPNDFYFVTTGRASGANVTAASRLFRLRFADITQPELGGTIELMLDGTYGNGLAQNYNIPVMMDNLCILQDGLILIQEDPGNNDRLAKIWAFEPEYGTLTEVAGADAKFFTTGAAAFITRDEEASGIMDACDLLGPGWVLFDVQAHSTNVPVNLVEHGQLLAMQITRKPVVPGIRLQPVAGTVVEGASARFEVAGIGTGPLSYQWRRNGLPVAGASNAWYEVGSVSAANIGNYDVIVSNASGSITSTVASLSLIPAEFAGAANKGLVGVGRLSGDAFDQLGAGIDTLGGIFSSLAWDPATLQVTGDAINGYTYSGTFYGLPDRGFGDGAQDYHPRVQVLNIAITPYYGTNSAPQTQIVMTNTSTLMLTDGTGANFTGFDPNDTNFTAYPRSLPDSLGQGKFSLDPEGLVRLPDGSYFISDEYGPNIYKFSSAGELQYSLPLPAALVPKAGIYPAYSNLYTATLTPPTGRRSNRGVEGLTITPDGTRLIAMLQSPTLQDGGAANGSRNTRILVYDLVETSPTYRQLIGEYVYQLTLKGNATNNRHTPVSEVLAINNDTLLILERDGNGLGGTVAAPTYKSIVLASLRFGTNIINTGYDLDVGAPGQLSFANDTLPAGIGPVFRQDLVNMIDPAQLAKFGLNLSTNQDNNTVSEKWEGLALVPMNDPAAPNDFLLLIGNDNDFKSTFVVHNGSVLFTNSSTMDNILLAFRVTLPSVGQAAGANLLPTVAITSPTNATLSAPAQVGLTAAVYDQDGKVTLVEFYQDGAKVGQATGFPYAISLPNMAAGVYTFTAVATDNSGAMVTSAVKTVTVTLDNLAPLAAIVNPANGTNLVAGNLPLTVVTATDPDGSIAKVEFFADGGLLGEDASAPYTLVWSNALPGGHTLHVVATDNQGQTSNSIPIAVTVLPNVAPSFVKGANLVVAEDAAAQTVTNWATSISAGPAYEAGQSLTFVVTNDNPGLFMQQPAINSAGRLTYRPAANSNGTAMVAVYLKDNGGTFGGGVDVSATEQFSITVTPVNDAPIAASFTATNVVEEMAAQIMLAGSDTDAGDTLTYIIVEQPLHGTVGVVGNLATYSPATGYNGLDQFKYVVTDGTLTSAVVTVTLPVQAAMSVAPQVLGMPTNYPVGVEPVAVAVADLNRDGKLDVAVVNANFDTVSLLMGNGLGAFTNGGTLSPEPFANSIVAVDLKRDGRMDLVVGLGGTNQVALFLAGTVYGTFTPPIYVDVGGVPVALAASDVNKDLYQDLVVAHSGGTIAILMGGRIALGTPTVITVGGEPSAVLLRDLNGDGHLDIAVSDQAGGTVTVLLGNGTGSFTVNGTYPVGGTGSQPRSLIAADLNGDMKPDLATANGTNNTISVLWNDGAGQFTSVYTIPNGMTPVAVAAEDLNNDKKLDLIVADYHANQMAVLFNDGGTFAYLYNEPLAIAETGEGPIALATGKFNRDTYPDLVSVNYGSSNITVVLNTWNTPRVLGQSLTLLEDHALPITLTGNRTSLNYVIIQGPTNGVLEGENGNLTYLPATNSFGRDFFKFRGDDGFATSIVATVTMLVRSVNDQPGFSLATNLIVIGEDTYPTLALPGFATNVVTGPANESAQRVRFVVRTNSMSGNTNLLFGAAPQVTPQGVLRLLPRRDAVGVAQLSVEMIDSGGVLYGGVSTSATHQFTVQITNINDAPRMSVVAGRTVHEDRATNYVFTVSDPLETPAGDLVVTVASLDANILDPAEPGAVQIVNVNGAVTVTVLPRTNAVGRTTLIFTVSDGQNTASRSAMLNVLAVNDPPSFTLATTTVDAATNAVIVSTNIVATLSKGPANEAAQGLTFKVVSNTNPGLFGLQPGFVATAPGTLTFRPRGITGTAQLGVQLLDAGGTAYGGSNTTAVQTVTINLQ